MFYIIETEGGTRQLHPFDQPLPSGWWAIGVTDDPNHALYPQPVRIITKLAFRRRFTLAERIALDAAREGLNPALPAEAVSALRTMQKDLDLAEDINLDDADVVAGLAFVQSLGLITAERAAEVLA